MLWEDHINKVKEDSCYNIIIGTVRSFNGTKYVSIGEKATIVNNIGGDVDDLAFDESGGIVVARRGDGSSKCGDIYQLCKLTWKEEVEATTSDTSISTRCTCLFQLQHNLRNCICNAHACLKPAHV